MQSKTNSTNIITYVSTVDVVDDVFSHKINVVHLLVFENWVLRLTVILPCRVNHAWLMLKLICYEHVLAEFSR